MPTLTYSIVVPVFNEEETLDELFHRLRQTMDQLGEPWEAILVDDGSIDASYERMTALHKQDPRFKSIRLSRNFGHQVAITAGLDFASGRAVVIMDADLQDPPELIPEMAAKWREGHHVVYATRQSREDENLFKRATASLFYRLLNRLADTSLPADVGDFRLADRTAVDAFKGMRENNRYVRGLFGWIGFSQTSIPYARAGRHAGTTKFSVRKMLGFAGDAVVSFSNLPLRLALGVGFVLAFVSVLAGIVAVALKLLGGVLVPGWASIIVAVCFLGAIQLIVLGVMGEYIARIYDEVKNRPLYLIREARGVGASSNGEPRRLIMPSIPSLHVLQGGDEDSSAS
jgi:glycosyltransferase involved in cell wall biosynthesis